MRTKSEIYRDYLILLRDEGKLNYTDEKIEKKVAEEPEVIHKLIFDETDGELYKTEIIKGQRVFSERAFYIFCDIVVGYDLKTGDKIWNNFVKSQFLLVEQNKQTCYMASRGSGKTFLIALFMIFKMFLIPYYDFCYCSNVPIQKRRFLKVVRSIIDNNELLLEKKDSKRIANREIPWGTNEVEYNDGLIEGTSVGTTPRGGHYNHAFIDDPLRDDKKYTYEFIVNYIQGVLKQTILRKKGRYTVVGTPQSDDDPFHTLMNDKLDKNNRPIGKVVVGKVSYAGFYSEIFPGILDDKKKIVLVPEIWTYEELMIEKQRIGEIRFNREILCICTSYKNALIGSSLFRSCCDEKLRMLQKGEVGKRYVAFIDSATSDAPTADYFAMTIWEDNPQGKKFIMRHLEHKKGFPVTDPSGGTDDQHNLVYNCWEDFNHMLVVIEKNNAGIALIQAVQNLAKRKGKSMEIIEHYTHVVSTGRPTEKAGKANDVIDYIELGLKSGVVVFPSDSEDIYTIDSLEQIKAEHLNFGVKKGKSGEKYEALAGHDDILDSCFGAFKFREGQVDTLPMAITMSGTNEIPIRNTENKNSGNGWDIATY